MLAHRLCHIGFLDAAIATCGRHIATLTAYRRFVGFPGRPMQGCRLVAVNESPEA